MRAIRRHDYAPRLELTPMLDVIFLLLCFFVYSVVMMIQAEVLPVKLMGLSGSTPAAGSILQAITVDRQGSLFFNREPVTLQQLDERLIQLAANPTRSPLYLAMEEQGAVDRGPLLISLIDRVRAAGIQDFVIVGQPAAYHGKSPAAGEKP